MEINLYQKSIEYLVSLNYTVVQLFPFGERDSAFYYIANQFTPSTSTPIEDIRYNQLTGVNITDFLINTSSIDKFAFKSKLDELMKNADTVRIEFPQNIRWIKYASSSR